MSVKTLSLARWAFSRFYGKGLGRLAPIQTLAMRIIVPHYPIVELNGFKLKVNTHAGGINMEIYENKEYEPEATKIFSECLHKIGKQSIVVDVGANIGYYSILAGKIAQRVYAIEPLPEALALLQENVRINKLSNILSYNIAAWEHDCKQVFHICSKEWGGSSLLKHDTGRHIPDAMQWVRCRRLDSIIKEKVDLVKIDTEGTELSVLKGMTEILKNGVPYLFVECWEEGLKKNGDTVEDIRQYLLQYADYKFYNIGYLMYCEKI